VQRSPGGPIRNLVKKKTYVNHYSFHIIDPVFGHVTIKMSGHPPFGAQIILNGHEHAAVSALEAGWRASAPGSGIGVLGVGCGTIGRRW
jgi:hypothetical protein